MWQCPQCEYLNDEPAEVCERCQFEREQPPAESTREQSPQQTVGPHLSAAGQDVQPPRRWSKLERIALIVILVCAVGLIALALYAWRTGFSLTDLRGSGSEAAASASSDEASGADQGVPADHPLNVIYTDKQRGLKRFQRYADSILEFERQLGQLPAPDLTGKTLTEETVDYLAQLNGLGNELLDSYQDFEDDAQRQGDAGLAPYLEALRQAYLTDMKALLDKTGEVYARDDYAQHAAYGLSDVFAKAVEEASPDGAEELRQLWLEYAGQRQEYLLNMAQVEETRHLSALLASLQEIRSTYQDSMSQLPPYEVHNGLLDKAGRDILDLLDSLASNIEVVVREYEEYTATLNVAELSNANRDLLDQFEKLAQQDHLYAFTETYRIYAQDRRLDHPAYARLGDHYEFVAEHWPELEMSYRRVYSQYEGEWAATWGKR